MVVIAPKRFRSQFSFEVGSCNYSAKSINKYFASFHTTPIKQTPVRDDLNQTSKEKKVRLITTIFGLSNEKNK